MEDDATRVRADFLRRMGRNVWAFQQLEQILKALVRLSHGHWRASDDRAQPTAGPARLESRGLGELIGYAGMHVFRPAERRDENAPGFSWSMSFQETIPGVSEALLGRLEKLRKERNALIHHAVERWDIDDANDLEEACVILDDQRSRIELAFSELQQIARMFDRAAKQMIEFLQSSDFRAQWESAHLQGCLMDAVRRAASQDGWVPLDVVGQLFHEHKARLTEEQRRRLPALAVLLRSSELFDLLPVDENGVTRCRLRSCAT